MKLNYHISKYLLCIKISNFSLPSFFSLNYSKSLYKSRQSYSLKKFLDIKISPASAINHFLYICKTTTDFLVTFMKIVRSIFYYDFLGLITSVSNLFHVKVLEPRLWNHKYKCFLFLKIQLAERNKILARTLLTIVSSTIDFYKM